MEAKNTETREFQTEIKQLLDIVINSLYTDRQIFLRELISNAADATERFRYMKLTGVETKGGDLPLEILIETNDEEHKLIIRDNGTGMTRDELVANLGTIAHSGSKQFVEKLKQHQSGEGGPVDVSVIGQFGVGFYAAFMVAQKVTIETCSYLPDGENLIWVSDGSGSYSIEAGGQVERGTKITLDLKEDAFEYGKPETIQRVIKQYSSFVPYPVSVNGEKVNTVEAIWMKNKNEISEEEYTEFYKYTANAYDEPLYRLHFSSDAPLALNALLFVPQENYERFGFSRMERGVNLYCKKILIQEKSENIVPEWMRFVRGIIDSADLPLNISREMLQDSALIAKLNKVVTTRFLKFLNTEAKNEPEKYKDFWQKFSNFIKEGAASDFSNREELVKLLRFESNKKEAGELVSLQEYIDRMPENQKAVYYVNGPTREAIEAGPYLEQFKEQDCEVLYTFEAIDDYVLEMVREFQNKKLVSAEQDSEDLPTAEQDSDGSGVPEEERDALVKWFKEILGERVTEVRISKRLTDSPAVTLTSYGTHSMQRMMQVMEKDLANIPPGILEINCQHPIVIGINDLRKAEDPFAGEAAGQLLQNVQIAAGLIVDPRTIVSKMNEILARAVQA